MNCFKNSHAFFEDKEPKFLKGQMICRKGYRELVDLLAENITMDVFGSGEVLELSVCKGFTQV